MVKRASDCGTIEHSELTDEQSKQRVAAHYREYATQLRDLADREWDPVIRNRLRELADDYDTRADDLDPQP